MTKIDLDATVKAIEQGDLPEWIADHLRLYNESGGKEGHMWESTAGGGKGLLPCLLLHSIGRKSGREIDHPLIYGKDGDNFIIVGSKGGSDTHPAWYFNLLAAPNVMIQVATEKIQTQASIVDGPERERLWLKMVDLYPPYLDYQAKTDRTIPICVLAPQR